MPRLAFDWVDAFTDRPFGGNGCAVVHGAADLDDATCMRLVRETSLVECTFLAPSERADWRVRYFLANAEIPFAGHPTLATAVSLADRGMAGDGRMVLDTRAGDVPVTVEGGARAPRVTMIQQAPDFGDEVSPDLVAAAVGLHASDIAAQPQVISTGLPFCITLLQDHDALRRAALDATALARLRAALSGDLADVTEPFLVALGGATADGDTVARLLLPPPNLPEDPFTGSATGAMAAYLWQRSLIGEPSFVAEQGHWMDRPGRAEVEVLGPPSAIEGVRVTGQGHVLMRGELFL